MGSSSVLLKKRKQLKVNANIPWSNQEEWDQVLLSIKQVERSNPAALIDLHKMAVKIRGLYESLSESIAAICSHTCTGCQDICCVRASIWFDFKDLLYIYFGLDQFPRFQIRKISLEGQNKACRHLTKKGCVLSRIERPFVCTWYFCSSQKKYLTKCPDNMKEKIDQVLLEIKDLRKRMEEQFIFSVAGSV